MKIFSKFHDYYDSAAAHGVDDHIHWIRNESEIESKTDPFYDSDICVEAPSGRERRYLLPRDAGLDAIEQGMFFVGFCGKMYPVIKFTWGDYDYTNLKGGRPTEYAYNTSDVEDVLMKMDKKGKLLDQFNATSKKSRFKQWRYNAHASFNVRGISSYFDKHSGSEHMDLFVRHNTPVFVYGAQSLWLNPRLKDYHFQRIMNPFAAYQEIEMFLSGILGMNDPETVHIDDKHLAKQKGFDDWSFKKLPTKKR